MKNVNKKYNPLVWGCHVQKSRNRGLPFKTRPIATIVWYYCLALLFGMRQALERARITVYTTSHANRLPQRGPIITEPLPLPAMPHPLESYNAINRFNMYQVELRRNLLIGALSPHCTETPIISVSASNIK